MDYPVYMIHYQLPENWIRYDYAAVAIALTDAKAAVMSLTQIPYQRSWAERLQTVQLKREIAGTSKIEGAEFTEEELDSAISGSSEDLFTRSQRQAAASKRAYVWISELPEDRPIDEGLVREIHRQVITGADDDHCPPGILRGPDQNVTFGIPRHRGVPGGDECSRAFSALCDAVQTEFPKHDPLIQALAFHYHFAAMHPFIDGNGRTARALEALMLQRTGLRDVLFIAMSNYYYDEKLRYLETLTEVRSLDHDLTPFIVFGLRGVSLQCKRLFEEIRINVRRALFRNIMHDLFGRLRSTKKRVIAERQIHILEFLLEKPRSYRDLSELTVARYTTLRSPQKALARDLSYLIELGAINAVRPDDGDFVFSARLEWPTEITETEFFKRLKELPKAKNRLF